MEIEDFLVVFGFLCLSVERSNESLMWLHAVAVSLELCGKDECVVNETCKDYVVGAAASEPCGGRAILIKRRKLWEYNPTRGYPGQDIRHTDF